MYFDIGTMGRRTVETKICCLIFLAGSITTLSHGPLTPRLLVPSSSSLRLFLTPSWLFCPDLIALYGSLLRSIRIRLPGWIRRRTCFLGFYSGYFSDSIKFTTPHHFGEYSVSVFALLMSKHGVGFREVLCNGIETK